MPPIPQVLAVVEPDTESLQRENARLLALLRSHPPPRPPMLPNRRLRLAARNKWRCHACGELLSEAFDIDHVTPWCETFDDSDANCVPLRSESTRTSSSGVAPSASSASTSAHTSSASGGVASGWVEAVADEEEDDEDEAAPPPCASTAAGATPAPAPPPA